MDLLSMFALIETRPFEVCKDKKCEKINSWLDLKEKLESQLDEQRRCLARNMRLSIVGRQLDQDTMKLNEISLTEESIITLIRVHDSTMTARYVHSNTSD